MKRKIIVLTLILCIFFQALAFTASAVSSTKDHTITASSNIMEDLETLQFDGKKFNEVDFPASTYDKFFYVMRFLETGFDAKTKSFTDAAAIFIYVYNPSKQHIEKDSGQNRISMRIGTDASNSGYLKYGLIYCGSSTDNRFLKYQVNIDVAALRQYLSSSTREYRVSEIELYRTGLNATSYKVGGSYTYSGTGEDLFCLSNDVYTLELELTSTYYRPDVMSSGGADHRNELASVYFSIPNSALKNFGKLYSVQGEYYENRIVSIVTQNPDYYDIMHPLEGTAVTDLDGYKESQEYSPSYPRCYGDFINVASNVAFYDYGINAPSSLGNSLFKTYFMYNRTLSCIPYIFYAKRLEMDEICVTSEQIKKRVEEVGLITLSGNQNTEKTLYDISVEDGYTLKSYASTHNDFQTFLAKLSSWGTQDLSTDVFVDSALVSVGYSEIKNMSLEGASDFYFVDVNDVQNLRIQCSLAEAKDETVYLLRFAQSEVATCKMQIDANDSGIMVNNDQETYLFEQTYYKDFDVLSLTFEDEHGEYVVVPVASDPIDVVGDIVLTDDFPKLGDMLKDAWKYIVAIVLILLLLIVLILIFQPYFDTAFKNLSRNIEAWWRKFKNSLKPKKRRRNRTTKQRRKYSRFKKE